MEDYRLITMKECEEVELQKCMDTIKEKNILLYKSIMRCLKKEDFKGMRDDVLHCLADNADRFENDKNMEISFQIADLLQDQRIKPEYFEWLISYWNTTTLTPSAVIVLFMMALDKKLRLEEIQFCFESEDEMSIFERIEGYSNEDKEQNESNAITVVNTEKGNVQNPENEQQIRNRNGIVSVFSDLLTVMSSSKQFDGNDTVLFQKKFTELMTCLQNNINEVNAFAGEIIHEWEKDKDEVRRLRAIYNIQQSALSRQQQNLYDAEDEISRLQAAVRDAEKMEQHYETISQKVEEIQKLTNTANSIVDWKVCMK